MVLGKVQWECEQPNSELTNLNILTPVAEFSAECTDIFYEVELRTVLKVGLGGNTGGQP
jgi:hypothetical protein